MNFFSKKYEKSRFATRLRSSVFGNSVAGKMQVKKINGI